MDWEETIRQSSQRIWMHSICTCRQGRKKEIGCKSKEVYSTGYGVRVKDTACMTYRRKGILQPRCCFDEESLFNLMVKSNPERKLVEFESSEFSSDDVKQDEVSGDEQSQDHEESVTEVRRSTRNRGPPVRFGEWVNSASVQDTQSPEPVTVKEALNGSEKSKWKKLWNKR